MAVVVFDPTSFKTKFPSFAGFSNDVLQSNFDTATLFCNNSASSIVTDVTVRTQLLNLLTAHITQLTNGTNDGAGKIVPPSGAVGRLDIARQGTVHSKFDMGPTSAASAWFHQTQYGASYWAATVRYRTVRYIPRQATTTPTQAIPAIWPFGRW